MFKSSYEEKQIKEFREVMSRGSVFVKNSAPIQTHNTTKSSIKNLLKVGTKLEVYNVHGIRHNWKDTGEPKLVVVAKTTTVSCWIAPVGRSGNALSKGNRWDWSVILETYNRGGYCLARPSK